MSTTSRSRSTRGHDGDGCGLNSGGHGSTCSRPVSWSGPSLSTCEGRGLCSGSSGYASSLSGFRSSSSCYAFSSSACRSCRSPYTTWRRRGTRNSATLSCGWPTDGNGPTRATRRRTTAATTEGGGTGRTTCSWRTSTRGSSATR